MWWTSPPRLALTPIGCVIATVNEQCPGVQVLEVVDVDFWVTVVVTVVVDG